MNLSQNKNHNKLKPQQNNMAIGERGLERLLVIKSTGCYSEDQGLDSQHPHGCSKLSRESDALFLASVGTRHPRDKNNMAYLPHKQLPALSQVWFLLHTFCDSSLSCHKIPEDSPRINPNSKST